MKTIIAVTIAVLTVIPTSGYASNSLGEQILKKYLSGGVTGQVDHRPTAKLECADYSGRWKVKCTKITEPTDLEITQPSCDYIKLGGDFLYFGGMSGKSDYVPQKNLTISYQLGSAAVWSEKKDLFQLKLGGLYTFKSSHEAAMKVSPMSGQITYSIVDNKLIAKSVLHFSESTYEDECIGTKQN